MKTNTSSVTLISNNYMYMQLNLSVQVNYVLYIYHQMSVPGLGLYLLGNT